MSLKVGRGFAAFFAARSASMGSTPRATSFLAAIRPLRSSVLEADVGIGAEALVLPNAGDLIAQDPFLAAGVAHDEVEAIAVAVPSRLGRLRPPFRQPRHRSSPTFGPTL